ncbi:MAG: leucyl aminopeptidase [Candidatus Krumholzibacteriia bacterium]
MRWTVSKGALGTMAGDLVVLPVAAAEKGADLAAVVELAGGHGQLAQLIDRAGFKGEVGATLPVPCGGIKAGWVLLVGLGAVEKVSLQSLREAAAIGARDARKMGANTVIAMPTLAGLAFDAETVARCWVEGAELALAPAGPSDAERLADRGPRLWKLLPADAADLAGLRIGMRQGEIAAAGCLEARRLVNLPPNQLTPRLLAVEARGLAARHGYKCTVLGPAQLRKLKMGGILGVGQGSHNEPQLVVLESRTAPRGAPMVALVGKGVTFDTGGISLKPGAKMDVMKCDMAGAAAVLGAAAIVAERELPVRLIVAIPTAENMPGGGAIKPSDVLAMANGSTVEVLNTDAEGRLILADALHHVCRRQPDFVVDIATLTGACALALGQEFAGVMGTSSELIDVLEQAGGETGERVWPLPLIDAHREAIRSKVATIKNLGPREGGALTAAAFLDPFVPQDIAWAHVDIAGPAWLETAGTLGARGGTGFGARLLARTVELLVG